MNTIVSIPQTQATTAAIDERWQAAVSACAFIAPSWPLDNLIAVNPFWELRDRDQAEVNATVAALCGAHTMMNAAYYSGLQNPAVSDQHLSDAARQLGMADTPAVWRAQAAKQSSPLPSWKNICDLLDENRSAQQMAWHDEITHQISQFCARAFQSAELNATLKEGDLYRDWLEGVRSDLGIPILMDAPELAACFARLPTDRDQIINTVCAELTHDAHNAQHYAFALLLDINGWASWAAYLGWQQKLKGRHYDVVRDLLAIRMGWELALWWFAAETNAESFPQLRTAWRRQAENLDVLLKQHQSAQRELQLWQLAAEKAYQQQVCDNLSATSTHETAIDTPVMQAVFCIDVRSERIRRWLEQQHAKVQTIGFAGFFGLPLEFGHAQSNSFRPQLPGLLAPSLQASADQGHASIGQQRRSTRFNLAMHSPAAMFGMVESSGPMYAWKLFQDTFFPKASVIAKPMESIKLMRDGNLLNANARAELAEGILKGMGLTQVFADWVLLVGHGSSSANNAHRAALDCGACGGHSGAPNAATLAHILNDHCVRAALRGRGITIPSRTRFVPALHDTTTDALSVLDATVLPEKIQQWLHHATIATRKERAKDFQLSTLDEAPLSKALRKRSQDWAQLRPEWGLANNAAIIVAPRARTRHCNLDGRTFLHDYDWRHDADISLLEQIMTAPVVVAHWINAQYNLSTCDNRIFGSGNKVLHNVVGGHIGVFEGNGGDLRIGLPMQSLHDGVRWMHTPLRLSVFVDCPDTYLQHVYDRQAVVRSLIDQQWIHVLRISESGKTQTFVPDGAKREPAQ